MGAPMLDALPPEILCSIALCGPADNLRNLVQVNQALRNACHHRSVYRAFIKDFSGSSRLAAELLSTTSRETWSRWAVAVEEAERHLPAAGIATEIIGGDMIDPWIAALFAIPEDFYDWGPSLAIKNYPLFDRLIGQLADISLVLDERSQSLGFCVAAAAISLPLSASKSDASNQARGSYDLSDIAIHGSSIHDPGSWDRENWISATIATFRRRCQRCQTGQHLTLTQGRNPNLVGMHTTANRAIGLFVLIIRALELGVAPKSAISASRTQSRDAGYHLSSIRQVPPLQPFQLKHFDEFNFYHLKTMANSEYFSSGTWTGEICHKLNRMTVLHLPMRHMHFSAYKEQCTHGDVVFKLKELQPNLQGRLSPQTGALRMQWDDCELKGLLTPFGIMATSGVGDDGFWMWLWRYE